MNSFNTANLHGPPSTLNPPRLTPGHLNIDRLLPFFRAMKREDTKTWHKDNILGPHYRNSWLELQFSPYAVMFLLVKFWGTPCTGVVGENPNSLASFHSPNYTWSVEQTQELIQWASPHAGSWTVEWCFVPFSFPLSIGHHFSIHNPSFPHSQLQPTTSLHWQP